MHFFKGAGYEFDTVVLLYRHRAIKTCSEQLSDTKPVGKELCV